MNEIKKIYSQEQDSGPQTLKKLVEESRSESDPDSIFEDVWNKFSSPAYQRMDEGQLKLLHEREETKLTMAVGISAAHYPVILAVDLGHRPFAIKVTRQLIEEFDCKTSSEIMLAELAAIHYTHFITHSNDVHVHRQGPSFQKQANQASRQYMAAIGLLKQMKTPQISVNVSTDAAFFANNQQINTRPNQ
jgi:hypothetical protein